MRRLALILAFTFSLLSVTARADEHPDWTTQLTPFRIADNLYYVGSRDLASYLITTPQGDILINSNLESSPPQIRHSVEQLGFHWSDVKILLISHAHSDHDAGSAEILRETHAKYMVMDGDVSVVESGGATDFAYGPKPQYPPAHVDRILHDGDTVTLGNVRLTAHKTAGHTRGCTTWTMRVHLPGEPASQLRNVVIVGSWNVNPGYRLVATKDKPASYPGIANDFAHTFVVLKRAALRHLPRRTRHVLRHAREARAYAAAGRLCLDRSRWIPPRHRRTQSRIREGTRKTASRGFSSLAPSPAFPAPPGDDGHAPPSSRRSSTPSSFRAPDA